MACALTLLGGQSYVLSTDCPSLHGALQGETKLTLRDAGGVAVAFNDGWPGCPNLPEGTSSALLEFTVDCAYGAQASFTLSQDCVSAAAACAGRVSVKYNSREAPTACPAPPAPLPAPLSPPPAAPPPGRGTFMCVQKDATCEALGDLYYSLGGPRWLIATGWADAAAGRATDYCNFYHTGIASCKAGTLTQVVLYENYMSGVLPPSLGALSTLTSLGLNSNQIYGTVPESLGRLTGLKELWLSDNSLGGSLPASAAALTALTTLLLAASGLCGAVPTAHKPDDGALPACTSSAASVN